MEGPSSTLPAYWVHLVLVPSAVYAWSRFRLLEESTQFLAKEVEHVDRDEEAASIEEEQLHVCETFKHIASRHL